MKILWTFIALFLAGQAPPGEINNNLSKGLVAYYNFNGCQTKDSSGNGSDAEIFNGVSCWCGIDQDGLLFDGKDDYVVFNGRVNSYFTTSDFTLSFYFRNTTHTPINQSLFSKRPECTEEQMMDIQLNSFKMIVETNVYQSSYKYYKDISPPSTQSPWHHYAIVKEGLTIKTYINGELKKTETQRCRDVDITNDAQLMFSNSPCIKNGYTLPFKGVLDEVRVYDRSLKDSEIKTLYELFPIENAERDCAT